MTPQIKMRVSSINIGDPSVMFEIFQRVRVRKDAPTFPYFDQTGEFIVIGFQFRNDEHWILVRRHQKGDLFHNRVIGLQQSTLESIE